jgi:hypothetical protein
MNNSSILSPLMTIFSGPTQNLLEFKQNLMRNGKRKKMAGMGVREFQYNISMNSPTRGCRDAKNILSVEERSVGIICMKNIILWSPTSMIRLKVN